MIVRGRGPGSGSQGARGNDSVLQGNSLMNQTARLAAHELGALYEGLGRSLEAGLPPARALDSCKDLLPGSAARRLASASRFAAEGASLTGAMRKAGLLGRLDKAVIEASEASGRVDVALRRLAQQYTASHRRNQTIKGRLLYPVILFVAAIVLGPIPALFSGRITTGQYLFSSLAMLALAAAVAYLLVRLTAAAGRGELPSTLMATALRLPVIGAVLSLQLRVGLYRPLGLLLGAGLDAQRTWRSLHEATAEPFRRTALRDGLERLQNGHTVSEAIGVAGLSAVVSPQELAVFQAAEAAGRLPEALDRQAAACEGELEDWYRLLGTWVPFLAYLLAAGMVAGQLLG